MGQINRATEELIQLRIDAQKAVGLPPEEILKKYSKLIKSIVIENGKLIKIELHRL